VCWQSLADNDWIAIPGADAAQHVALRSTIQRLRHRSGSASVTASLPR
jgi:hypothetical protein